jgi:hypothetical protein
MRFRGGLACAVIFLFRVSTSGDESSSRGYLPHDIGFPFIANVGQIDSGVAFYVPGRAGTMFVTREGLLVHSAGTGSGMFVEHFVHGSAMPAGEEPGRAKISYFLGNDRSRWRNQVPTFRTVSLGDVWQGVSVVLKADGRGVEKIFTLAPFTGAASIRVRVQGVPSLRLADDGSLAARADSRAVLLTAPSAYQEIEGRRQPVSVRYEVSGREYGFRLGAHDAALPVVIDPLLQSTYLGGGPNLGPEGFDEALGVAIHPESGEVYVVGTTFSHDFPGTAGGAIPAISGFSDAFVARLDPTLRVLRQATFLGGNFSDSARSLAIQPGSGDVYVAGATGSTEFPGTTGGAQPLFGGTFGFGSDGFIARLDPSLTTLIQATYLGGMGTDEVAGIALHPSSDDLYAAGETTSGDFPGTAGGAQATLPGFRSAFVARLSLDLTSLRRATYVGGDHFSRAAAIAISEDVYVAGETASRDFPATGGGAQATFGGGSDIGGDAFAARLALDLATIRQTTYLGGNQDDVGTAIVLDSAATSVYVGGYTNSFDFPGTTGGAQPSYGGGIRDAFLVRLDARLTSLVQTTYFGGEGLDEARGIAIHPASGDIYAAGKTASAVLPGSPGGIQTTFGGGSDVGGDAFAARFNSTLTSLAQSTYLGGALNDEGNAVAVHPLSGDVYLVGGTFSTDFPGTSGGAQPTFGGFHDAFAAHLTSGLTGGPQGPAEPIPVVSTWGLLLLIALLATVAIYALARSSGSGST